MENLIIDISKNKIGEILVEQNIITETELKKALSKQKFIFNETKETIPLGQLLIKEETCSEEEIYTALAKQQRLTFKKISSNEVDFALAQQIPYSVSKEQNFIVFKKEDDTIYVLTCNHTLSFTIKETACRYTDSFECIVYITTPTIINNLIAKVYNKDNDISSKIGTAFNALNVQKKTKNNNNDKYNDQQKALIELTNTILNKGVQKKASDIHLENQESGLLIRYREDGDLYHDSTIPNELAQYIVQRLKGMANLDTSVKNKPQSGSFLYEFESSYINMRIEVMPTVRNMEDIVIRIMTNNIDDLDINKLDLPEKLKNKLITISNKKTGALIVTGPTGSGKTTTLYSLMRNLDYTHRKVYTIEDPPEYRIPGMTHIKIDDRPEVGMTFAKCLRSILRGDPDIILVGEIRDNETAHIVSKATATGHFVFSTLHVNNSVASIARLTDMGVDAFSISSFINAILAQRLVKRLCPKCKKPVSIPAKKLSLNGIVDLSRINIDANSDVTIYIPTVCDENNLNKNICPECKGKGFKGRIGLYELFVITPEIKQAILSKKSENELTRMALNNGMITLQEDGIRKVIDGITSLEEVNSLFVDKGEELQC